MNILKLLYGILSIIIFMIQFFNTLKMYGEKKAFVWGIVGITSLITIVINVIPMYQINKTIEFNESVYDIISSADLTFQNISTRLGEYIKEGIDIKINELDAIDYKLYTSTKVMDYQFYTSDNRFSMILMCRDIDSITNSREFKEFIQEIQEDDYDINGNVRIIERGRELYNNRIVVLICSLITNVIMGFVVIKPKKQIK